MYEINWHFNNQHLRLHYRRFPAHRTLWIDDEEVWEQKGWFDKGCRHFFAVGEDELELAGVVVNGSLTRHFLLTDSLPLPSDEEISAGISQADLLDSAGSGHARYWEKVTKLTKLNYLPQKDSHFWYRHRLVGWMSERLLSVRLDRPKGSRVMVSLIAHFPPKIEDEEALKQDLLADERLQKLFDSKRGLARQCWGCAGTYWHSSTLQTRSDAAKRVGKTNSRFCQISFPL